MQDLPGEPVPPDPAPRRRWPQGAPGTSRLKLGVGFGTLERGNGKPIQRESFAGPGPEVDLKLPLPRVFGDRGQRGGRPCRPTGASPQASAAEARTIMARGTRERDSLCDGQHTVSSQLRRRDAISRFSSATPTMRTSPSSSRRVIVSLKMFTLTTFSRPCAVRRVRPSRGEPAARLDVALVLVHQAAHEASAAPRDLRRVQGEALVLGELQAYRLELREPRRAAQLAPAPPHAPQQRGLVAHADLLQFDTGAEGARQVAHERAKVHPLLGGEVHDQLATIELPLGLGDLHLEAVAGHMPARLPPGPPFVLHLVPGAANLVVPRHAGGCAASASGWRTPPEDEHLRSAMLPTAVTCPRSSPRSACTMTQSPGARSSPSNRK